MKDVKVKSGSYSKTQYHIQLDGKHSVRRGLYNLSTWHILDVAAHERLKQRSEKVSDLKRTKLRIVAEKTDLIVHKIEKGPPTLGTRVCAPQ